MTVPIGELEAKDLLRKIARKTRANSILASEPLRLWALFLLIASPFIVSFNLIDMLSPHVKQALIAGGVVSVIYLCIEVTLLRRRLDAVVELIRLMEGDREGSSALDRT